MQSVPVHVRQYLLPGSVADVSSAILFPAVDMPPVHNMETAATPATGNQCPASRLPLDPNPKPGIGCLKDRH